MPNIYSKPITNYFNRVVTPRDERDYQRNIESYKIRKDAEQDDAAERNEELVKKKQKRQRDNKNQKLREKRKRRAFANDGRFTEIRARAARSQVIEDEVRLQELLCQLSLFEEPETIEELASGGDLVQDTFVEPDSDLDD